MLRLGRLVPFLAAVSASSALITGCAADTTGRLAGARGTYVCITNASSNFIAVRFTKYDTKRGDGQLQSGETACAEGTMGFGQNDVEGIINEGTSTELPFYANNAWLARPEIKIVGGGRGICRGGFSENDSESMALPTLKVEARRNPDNDWKQFAVVVRDGDGSYQGATGCSAVLIAVL